MSWDPVWEQVFRTSDWGKYPPEELVRFIARSFYRAPVRSDVRLLEVGCGTGANVWFMAREGFRVDGIDGSPTAIEKANKRLAKEGLQATLRVGDICHLQQQYATQSFDAVIDVACLWCNRFGDVLSIVRQIHQLLKPGGRFFSMLLADGSVGQGTGREIEPGTFTDISEGPLQGCGLNHFFTLDEVNLTCKPFDRVQIEYSLRTLDERRNVLKLWVVQAQKT